MRSYIVAVLMLCMFVFMLMLGMGCISSVPIVPDTPDSHARITSCQSIASTHNDFQALGFVFTGAAPVLAGVAAGESSTNPNASRDLGIAATITGAAALTLVGLASYYGSDFNGAQCGQVVGPLPVIAAKADAGVTTVVVTPVTGAP